MLTATFSDLLKAKVERDAEASEQRNKRVRKVDERLLKLLDQIKIQRSERAALEERKHNEYKARKAHFTMRAERDALVMFVLENTSVRERKDGTRYMQAKAGKAKAVRNAQARAALLNEAIRPVNGYPPAPYVRGEDYPSGGLLAAPRGGVSTMHMRGEFDRLLTYMKRIKSYGIDGTCDREIAERCECNACRVERMNNHLRYLARKLATVRHHTVIVKRGGTYREVRVG
jgi:hypothetical protein